MSVHSAGLLPYRYRDGQLQLLLVHPGGPFWARRDEGVWSLAKGLVEEGEGYFAAALREFREETGFEAAGRFIELGWLKQQSGKVVHAWGLEADFDTDALHSNTVTLEWPKGSGRMREYPEVDRGEWFDVTRAKGKIVKGQAEFIDRLLALVAGG